MNSCHNVNTSSTTALKFIMRNLCDATFNLLTPCKPLLSGTGMSVFVKRGILFLLNGKCLVSC